MKVINLKIFTFFVIFLKQFNSFVQNGSIDIGCRDESGNIIDWFYLYKLPNKYSNTKKSGLEYLFITPTSQTKWTMSTQLINSATSFPGQTLAPVYDKTINSDLLIAMYNDAPATAYNETEYDFTKGHTKGVAVANEDGGFWLVHSVPKYPTPINTGAYGYPKSGTVYGQSFLCISFKANEMRSVGKQLKMNEPNFYSSQVPDHLAQAYRSYVDALKMQKVTSPPFTRFVTLKSRFGSKFKSFAKSSNFKKELYEDLVAPQYDAGDFYVETWRHGTGNLDSDCSKATKVYNIYNISIETDEFIEFSTLNDHSKWMVSDDNNLICVGDINRQEHQKVRGGGTVCMQIQDVSKAYTDAVANTEPCRKKDAGVKFKNNKKIKRTKKWKNRMHHDDEVEGDSEEIQN